MNNEWESIVLIIKYHSSAPKIFMREYVVYVLRVEIPPEKVCV